MTYSEWIENYVSAQPNRFVRGMCMDATQKMAEAFPELRRECGFVTVLHPNGVHEEQHWWCVTPDGGIVDPTAVQFLQVFTYEAVDPANPSRPIPTGTCADCGENTFNGASFCSSVCEGATVAYLNSGF
jgi:hypothetical protein